MFTFIEELDKQIDLSNNNQLCEDHEAYFDCPICNQNTPWAPHVLFSNSKKCLEGEQFSVGKQLYICIISFF